VSDLAAHELLGHPDGLLARELAVLIRTRYPEVTAPDPLRIRNSEYVYLSGPDTYRHLTFFPVDDVTSGWLLLSIQDYLAPNGSPERLGDVLRAIGAESCVGYYEARDILIRRGRDRGLHLAGQSRSDLVSARTPGA
jgi:hypothetical protein